MGPSFPLPWRQTRSFSFEGSMCHLLCKGDHCTVYETLLIHHCLRCTVLSFLPEVAAEIDFFSPEDEVFLFLLPTPTSGRKADPVLLRTLSQAWGSHPNCISSIIWYAEESLLWEIFSQNLSCAFFPPGVNLSVLRSSMRGQPYFIIGYFYVNALL